MKRLTFSIIAALACGMTSPTTSAQIPSKAAVITILNDYYVAKASCVDKGDATSCNARNQLHEKLEQLGFCQRRIKKGDNDGVQTVWRRCG